MRFQVIERQAGETEWPFLAEKGRLACVPSFGMRVVMFFPWVAEGNAIEGFALDEAEQHPVIVSTDPIQLWSDVARAKTCCRRT